MITSSVVFDHRGRTPKGKEGPVEIRVTVDRKSYYVQTGVKVLAREFVAGVIVGREDSDQLNTRVRIINKNVLTAVNECLANGQDIDILEIRRKAWSQGAGNKSHSFIDWVKEQIPLLGLKYDTTKHYNTLVMRLEQFEFITSWADISVENIYHFDAWLHGIRGWHGEPICDAAVYNYHKCLKALLQRALRFGIITANPYDRLRGEFSRGERDTVDYLTEDEMQRIQALQLEPGSMIEKARDLFVFQMFTGLAYADAMAFDLKKYRYENGVYTYVGTRQKTGVQYVSRLLPPVVAIVEKYGGRVPVIKNSKYNDLLKGIGVAAGIHAPLHSHMARHTFATYMLNKKISLDSVSVMLGHTNTVQTRRYAKTLAQTVKDDFAKIAEDLQK